jgi:hypothetical protein
MFSYWNGKRFEKALFPVQICGLALYVVAFFLPACGSPDARVMISSGPDTNVMFGWQCAWMVTLLSFAPRGWTFAHLLLVLTACVNPLVLIYMAFTLSDWLPRTRQCLAIAIVCCLTACCVFLFHEYPVVVLIGFYVWLAGILVLLSPSIPLFRNRS